MDTNLSRLTRREFFVSASLVFFGIAARHAFASVHTDAYQSNPYISGYSGYNCYRVPALAISKNGTVLAFCGARLDKCEDDGDHDIVVRRSSDGGQSWGPLLVIANDGRNRCDIPMPVVLSSGRVVLLWVWNEYVSRKEDRGSRRVMVCHSDDDGLSWTPARDITNQVRLPGWKPWYGLGPGHGFVKQLQPGAGRIVIPARHGEFGNNSRSHLIVSDDDGWTWQVGAQALGPEPTSEATACELGNGAVMINSRGDIGYRLVTLSPDGGLTTSETYVDRALIEPVNGCQGSLLTYALNPSKQSSLLLFSNPAHSQFRTNGRIRLSRDNGLTWSPGYGYQRIKDGFTGYSDLARFSNGDVAILFESGASYRKGQFTDTETRQQFNVHGLAPKKGSPSHRINKSKTAGRKDNRHDGIEFRRIPFRLIEQASF